MTGGSSAAPDVSAHVERTIAVLASTQGRLEFSKASDAEAASVVARSRSALRTSLESLASLRRPGDDRSEVEVRVAEVPD